MSTKYASLELQTYNSPLWTVLLKIDQKSGTESKHGVSSFVLAVYLGLNLRPNQTVLHRPRANLTKQLSKGGRQKLKAQVYVSSIPLVGS